ncbi:MAG: hypothetical protein JSU86_15645 [Phycisphaerales bacterium]|nr:MAG: hypothetical protein JSU86_15645 [Phycisphaerales bacterium]
MKFRLSRWLTVAFLALTPFVVGCPGKDAVLGGIANGLRDGFATVVEEFVVRNIGQ